MIKVFEKATNVSEIISVFEVMGSEKRTYAIAPT